MEQKNKSNNNIEWCKHQRILANQGMHWCEKQLKDYPDCCNKNCPYYEGIYYEGSSDSNKRIDYSERRARPEGSESYE